EELRAGEGDRLGGRLRTREHAARVHADVVAFELSEVFPSLIGDAHPLCHKTSFQRGVCPPYKALRAPPENARSYPLIPRPARRTIANPNLFRPPPGVRAFRAPGKRRRHDRAGGGYSQRRGRNRLGERNLRLAGALSRRPTRILRGPVGSRAES